MYSVDKKTQLKDFASAIAVPVGLTDSHKWPVRAGTVIFPVRNHFVNQLLIQLSEANIAGQPQKWKEAFHSPTQLWRMSHHLVLGLLDEGMSGTHIAEKILLLLEGISVLSNGHYFEPMGSHKILNDLDVESLSQKSRMNHNDSRTLLSLSGALWAYSEVNYFVAHELTCEYHGAYELQSGEKAVVRDFINLCPHDLWVERDFGGLPKQLRIVTFHDNSLDISYDVYNNLFDNNGTLRASLLNGYAIADGLVVSTQDVQSLINCISEKIAKFADEVELMDKNAIAHKYMDIFWYRKKSLTDYLNIQWKPDSTLSDLLNQGLKVGPQKAKPKDNDKNSTKSVVEKISEEFDFSEFLVG